MSNTNALVQRRRMPKEQVCTSAVILIFEVVTKIYFFLQFLITLLFAFIRTTIRQFKVFFFLNSYTFVPQFMPKPLNRHRQRFSHSFETMNDKWQDRPERFGHAMWRDKWRSEAVMQTDVEEEEEDRKRNGRTQTVVLSAVLEKGWQTLNVREREKCIMDVWIIRRNKRKMFAL